MNATCKTICTLCSWQETNVWNPGATPNPNWSMKDGSSWLWIWTLTPASNDVSSAGNQRVLDQRKKRWKCVSLMNSDTLKMLCLCASHSDEVLTPSRSVRVQHINTSASYWLKWETPPSPVSPQTGRYSSCWMSSMSSSPLPIPPLVVMRGGRPSSPALNV